jgi:hypothetical protein
MSTPEEKRAAHLAQLRVDHADPEAWAALSEMESRGWSFNCDRELVIPPSNALAAPAYNGSCTGAVPNAVGGTVKELVESARRFEADQMRLKPEARSKAVRHGFIYPDGVRVGDDEPAVSPVHAEPERARRRVVGWDGETPHLVSES